MVSTIAPNIWFCIDTDTDEILVTNFNPSKQDKHVYKKTLTLLTKN